MIDVIHEINAVQRQVGTRVLGAGEARTITIARTYQADVEDVGRLHESGAHPALVPASLARALRI